MVKSKNYISLGELIDRSKEYSISEDIEILSKTKIKFDQTVKSI